MKLLKWFSLLFRRNVEVKSAKPTTFFYQQSGNCLESLLSDNCAEWHAGTKDGFCHYRVYKKGIDKLKAPPDEIFYDTYVYRGNTAESALLKAIKALSTKTDFKNEKNLKIPESYYG